MVLTRRLRRFCVATLELRYTFWTASKPAVPRDATTDRNTELSKPAGSSGVSGLATQASKRRSACPTTSAPKQRNKVTVVHQRHRHYWRGYLGDCIGIIKVRGGMDHGGPQERHQWLLRGRRVPAQVSQHLVIPRQQAQRREITGQPGHSTGITNNRNVPGLQGTSQRLQRC